MFFFLHLAIIYIFLIFWCFCWDLWTCLAELQQTLQLAALLSITAAAEVNAFKVKLYTKPDTVEKQTWGEKKEIRI